jgi:hypothetical protein
MAAGFLSVVVVVPLPKMIKLFTEEEEESAAAAALGPIKCFLCAHKPK